MNAAQLIIEKFGGQSTLAGLLGKGQTTVYHWTKTGVIPAKWRTILLKLARERDIELSSEDFDIDFTKDTSDNLDVIPDDSSELLPKASHYGELPLNGFFLSAAVVDGKRIFSERSLATAFGIKGGGAYWSRKKTTINNSAVLPEYLSANYLSEFITKELREKLNSAVDYISTSGMRSRGVDATILADICDVYVTAKRTFDTRGIINENINIVAKNAYDMIKGFAKVGIIALVDEVTGYDKIREKTVLQQFLEKFLLEEKGKLIPSYPDEFFESIFRMKNFTWKNINTGRKPQWMGHVINDVVYSRIAPKVLDLLRSKNPAIKNIETGKKYRKHKHTEFIDVNYGHPKLQEHLNFVVLLARASGYNWNAFKKLIDRSLPKYHKDGSIAPELGFSDID